jgi:hypothetical protein
MSNFEASKTKQATLRKQTGSLQQQVDELKTSLDNLVKVINQQLGPVPRKLSLMEEVIDALMIMSGFTKEDVEGQVKTKREEVARGEAESSKAALAEGVVNGYLTSIPTVAEKTILVATETDPAGKLVEKDGEGRHIYQGRVEVLFETLTPDMKELLLGKSVNETVDLPTGGKLQLNEVFAFDQEKMRAHFTQAMAKTTADAAALETAAPVEVSTETSVTDAPVIEATETTETPVV